MRGRLILVVGPSGSGKGTLIQHARGVFPLIQFPKSATTREKRGGQSDANYIFLNKEEFAKKADNNEFLEWAEYGGNLYGTLHSEVTPLIESGYVVIKELEVQGARQIISKMTSDSLAIVFVNAGTWKEMEARIRKRADMPESELMKRKERYEDEMSFMQTADFVVQNPEGQVDRAKKQFEDIVRTFVS